MFDSLSRLWSAVATRLDDRLFSLGNTTVTTGGVVRVLATVGVAVLVSRALRGAIGRVALRWPAASQSSLYALGRILHYAIVLLGLIVGLTSLGFDFTTFTVLVGALGLGIGFGLQDIIANFIAGLIILFERHLRVGDFIELESGVAGEVREIRMRATRITTNDSLEVLVPNVDFVRGRVTNWTLNEIERRLRVPFGVAYGSDKDTVRAAGLEAAERVSFTAPDRGWRSPQVWLVGFGDSSLQFELLVWVTLDGVKRPGAARATYLWELHSALARRGIEVPFPQRDLHVRTFLGLDQQGARDLVAATRLSRDAGEPPR
jgi:small-conductance mechanosensitive channel